VALITLHPAYLAKSYFPNEFLRTAGMEAIGKPLPRDHPERTTKKAKKTPAPEFTAELVRGRAAAPVSGLARAVEKPPGDFAWGRRP